MAGTIDRRSFLKLGAASAGPELISLAECLEAPVFTTLSGKGVFPENHPLFLWPGFGEAAPPFAREVAAGLPTAITVASRTSAV